MGFIFELLIEFVLWIVWALIWWLLMFPVAILLALPVILVLAAFRRPGYRRAVLEMVRQVIRFWRDNGIFAVSF